jgi:hypothetical protein
MSLADTAALVSSLELKDKFTPTVNKYDKAIGQMERRTSTLGQIGGHLSQGIGTAIANVTKLAIVGVGAIGTQVKFGIDSLEKLEKVTTQTNAVLKSTQGVAGETADSIRALAQKYEDLNATIDDKVIQSGENLLLSFTSIRKDAFEPALKAALDLNQALGGGEAGLQGVVIQVGKALQDPVRGLTALRRVGVAFSDDQQKQIKDLVKHNKLYEAQQIILAELTKEFGGSFAAAGQTATGKFAKLRDAVDDAQMALAEGFLPVLTDIATELSGFLKDPSTLASIREFGKGLAGAFRSAFEWVKKLDFKGIGNALKTATGIAGTLIGKFMDAPDWLKTAVVTGWGLNKLTGGALTNIGGDIASAIGKQLFTRGSSPANPLFVKDIGGLGGLPGVGAAAGEGAAAAGAVGSAGVVLSSAALAVAVAPIVYGIYQQMNYKPGDPTSVLQNKYKPYVPSTPNGPRTGGVSPDDRQAIHDAAQKLQDVKDASQGTASEIIAMGAASKKANANLTRISGTDFIKKFSDRFTDKKISDRSTAKYGHAPSQAAIDLTRNNAELHELKVIVQKSPAKTETKLARLEALAKDAKTHGDTVTARKIQTAIDKMKASLGTNVSATTTAVRSGTNTLDAAIRAWQATIVVNVDTTVVASDVQKKTQSKTNWGPSNPQHPNKGYDGP